MRPAQLLILALFFLFTSQAIAQQSERFGDLELHYSVVNTTFLAPEVAAAYNITRSKNRAIVNLSLRRHHDGTTSGVPMRLKGTTSDLMQRQQVLDFREVREGDAVYSIASFKFINEDWHVFKIDFLPEGAERSLSFSFKQQMYFDE
ncbi:MAG: DUF4426 domain-containing protein [Halioglobus sp.]